MIRKLATARRVPRQARALTTVDIILEAAAQVLVEQGYERATTTRIAAVAGVSIGTLYQYFPSKGALVLELSRRQSERVISAMSVAAQAPATETLTEGVRALVRALVDAYSVNPRLHKLVLEESPRVHALRSLGPVEQRVEAIIRGRLARHRDELRSQNLELAAFAVCRAVRAVVWGAVIERPELLGSSELLDEASALALGYLRKS